MTEGKGRPRIGEILVSHGLAAPVEVARVAAHSNGAKLASDLYRQGVASERALAFGLAEQRGHPAVVLSESVIELRVLDLVPRSVAESHRLLPVAVDFDTVTLAVSTLDEGGMRRAVFDQVELATGRRALTLLGLESILLQAIAAAYDARSRGEPTLVGNCLPAGAPRGIASLSVVRPRAHLRSNDHDPLLAPTDAPRTAVPVVLGTALEDKPYVLVVDDEDEIRGLLRKLLAFDGYQVVEARTGREALEVLRTLRPALVLLDAMLPEVHGFDICRTLKGSVTFRETPVVMITAVYRGFEHARTAQEACGADAFVEKPFDIHYIRQLASRLTGKALSKAPLAADFQQKVEALREEAQQAYAVGQYGHAEEAIKRWRALDPFDARAHLLFGNVRAKCDDPDGAMKAYERAATFDGGLYAAFKNLAVVYDHLGFVHRAQMAWYRAYELAPDAETRRRIEERLARR